MNLKPQERSIMLTCNSATKINTTMNIYSRNPFVSFLGETGGLTCVGMHLGRRWRTAVQHPLARGGRRDWSPSWLACEDRFSWTYESNWCCRWLLGLSDSPEERWGKEGCYLWVVCFDAKPSSRTWCRVWTTSSFSTIPFIAVFCYI